jgi:hypothetical protein
MQITQNLNASKHYDLIARIPIHNSYGEGFFWVWSKDVGEARSPESVVCKVLCAGKIELNLEGISLYRPEVATETAIIMLKIS